MRVCPRCATTSVETTTVGYYGLDMNKATCRGPGCGWVGRAHEMATTEAGAEAAREAVTDCGDGSCILRDRSKPSGMRTNGGCQHYKRSGPELNAQLRAMGAEIVRLRGLLGTTEAALRNVLALSHRLAQTDPENAAHLRRFCAEAGVAPSITREAHSDD